jgi:multisubunit Na+/H+ antiporter MnhF subunit
MDPRIANRVLIALSFCYGGLIAILAILNSSATAVVAVIGAIVLGLLWSIRGLFVRRNLERRGPDTKTPN